MCWFLNLKFSVTVVLRMCIQPHRKLGKGTNLTDVMIISKREGSTNKTVIQYASVHEERIYAAITFFFFFFYLGCILQSFI